MSQNVPIKKFQVANRQRQVSELFLKNVSVTNISEMLGVDRKTIQRDLQQVKFNFGRSVPSEEAYNFSKHVLYEQGVIFSLALKLFNSAPAGQQLEHLKMIKKLWESKAFFLAKIGVFDCIPAMLDENHGLHKDTLVSVIKPPKNEPKPNKNDELRELILKNKMLDKLAKEMDLIGKKNLQDSALQ